MPTAAVTAQGANIKIKHKTTAALTKISGLKDFSGIYGGSPAVIDVTDLDSTSKEKLMGTPDEGSISATFNFLPADAGQAELVTARAGRELRNFVVALGTAVGSKTYTFDGYVMTASPSASVDAAIDLSVTIEISGPITPGAVV